MHQALPSARFDVASFGELVSDPSRVAMLLSLMDGRARPASELARIAGVTPQTGSSHLRRLLSGGLVLAESVGRHRYFRLAGDHVADVLEAITLHSVPRRLRSPSDPARVALARARTCYKHLAGELGVAWLASLEKRCLLRVEGGALTLAPAGVTCFEALGLTVARWPAGKPCLDWTERRNHLGGALGGLLTQYLLERGWVARLEEGRALRITAKGRQGFSQFGIARAFLSGASQAAAAIVL
ncbi:MAG TPA: winged helix-turn-helix domain-containing protein [Polyangiaceae bacterium]|jgi:DNA-binding transcriptional ArsR family regulator